ncbi:L-ascorbate oxidase [Cladophialophora bantiana CBS 173.52]|uniref:L-ascorbate oxidase n=1 Tax=Cladophialophora bantiana (strain ATCC 10958 / CBS 173.52 / CDC B-1940 / NIH 8579) TaxID=1442370 RepID=A0A0D2HBM8_CLAB1|nr:L-ascorbate oxidase [Cladophialophora bantiana CBS 173.52]KIW88330.1 L-ascorbate oxidase [Cladophialophora bantiana CBS 173.52]
MGTSSSPMLVNKSVPGIPYFTPAHAADPGAPFTASPDTPTLFTPLRIRSKTLRNRIIVAPMCQYSTASSGPDIGKLTDYHIATLGHYALKGAALVFIEATGVQPNGRISPNCPGLWSDAQTESVKRVSDFVRSQGALSGIQLAHAGRKSSTMPPWLASSVKRPSVRADKDADGWPDDVVGPMGGPEESWDGKGLSQDGGFWPPRQLSVEEIQGVVKAFAESARRAVEAGIDVIEIHAAHGYLIHQFLSPITNRRTDQYGGSFENRTRMLVEVIKAVRAQIPQDMPLFLRVSSTEWMEETDLGKQLGSWDVENTMKLARLLPGLGVDLLDASSGGNHPRQRINMFSSKDYQTKIAHQIRQMMKANNLKLLIGAVGLITEAEQARDIVDDKGSDKSIGEEANAANEMTDAKGGKEPMADVILVARQFMREPEWVLKVGWKLGVDVAWPSQFLRVRFPKLFTPDIVLRVSVDTVQLNCQPRLSTLVNGTYPAPPIYLEPERTTWIRVYNDANHWHGLSLAAAPFADGAPLASQWPIPPGHFYDYELHPSGSEAGTSFYHSHVGFQAITASGALIIKDAMPPPYVYDDEIILKIGDFYPEDDQTIESQLTDVPWIWPGDPTSLLINGQSGTAPNASNPGPSDPSCQPWIMNVETNKTYRVRLIGSTALSLVLFGLEHHDNLTIIETDNSYVYPVETSYMQIDTGQRFSFLLKTKSQSELDCLNGQTRFWIQFETREGQRTVFAWAILNYADTNIPTRQGLEHSEPGDRRDPASNSSCPGSLPPAPILDLPANVTGWLEYAFQNPPLAGYEAPPNATEVTRRIIISTSQFLNNSSGYTVMLSNNEYWTDTAPLGPTTNTPYLVEILQNGTINGVTPDYGRAIANGAFDPLSQMYPARIGEVLEIVWQNAASYPAGIYGLHPMHAHGGPYWDLGSGSGEYSPEAHAVLLESYSAGNGPYPGSRRDTTLLYKYTLQAPQPGEVNGWRVWRIRITERNIGVWMMHCHILQHIVMGQQTVWVFGTPEEIRANSIPVQGNLEGYFTYGGDVMGKAGEEEAGIDILQFFRDG